LSAKYFTDTLGAVGVTGHQQRRFSCGRINGYEIASKSRLANYSNTSQH
jgi:hypothetical protein